MFLNEPAPNPTPCVSLLTRRLPIGLEPRIDDDPRRVSLGAGRLDGGRFGGGRFGGGIGDPSAFLNAPRCTACRRARSLIDNPGRSRPLTR
jgi:hypothetical protein